MSLDMGRNRIYKEFEVLRLRWEAAQLTWQDVVRHEFTEQYWNPLDQAVLTTLGALDRLAPVLAQARQECAGREWL
ncbi:MAG: hypothetical protein NZO58_12820 [Gemmataceae bacterium]|nr:hypothetical protein [Gemmataceae bacterium]